MLRVKSFLSKIWYPVLVTVVISLLILLVGFRVFGFQMYVVLSGSMEPAYHTGSLLYSKEVDTSTLEVGDVVVFNMGNGFTATHRIVEFVEDDGVTKIKTKGDANKKPDASLVSLDEIRGKAQFSIPYLGYVLTFIKQPPGLYLVVAICIAWGVASVLYRKDDGE